MIFSNRTVYPELSAIKHLRDITKKYKDVEVQLQFYEVVLDQFNSKVYDIRNFSGNNRIQIQGFVKGIKRGISYFAPFIVKMPFVNTPEAGSLLELYEHYMSDDDVLKRINCTIDMVENILGCDTLEASSISKNITESARKIFYPSICADTYHNLKTDIAMLKCVGTLSIVDYWADSADPEYFLQYTEGFKYLDVPESSLKVLGSIIRAIDEDDITPSSFDRHYRGTMLNLYGPFSERVKFSHGPKWGITLEYTSGLEGVNAGNSTIDFNDGDTVQYVYNINTYSNDVKYDNTLLARSFSYSSWDSEVSNYFQVKKAQKRIEVFVSADDPIIVDLGRIYD